jgi:hypothetical protein
MRQMVTRCLIITATIIIIAGSSQGIIYGGNEDSGYFPSSYQCSDHSPGLKGYKFLAESIHGVFVWNGMYCYLVPDATCDGRNCEPIRLCCTDVDKDGLYDRCGPQAGGSCSDGAELVTAYCKK